MKSVIQKTTKVLRYVLISAVLAVAVNAGVAKVAADIPGQVGNAPRCTVESVGPRGSAFHPSGSSTTVKFKVSGSSNCKVQLSANSFYAPSMNGKPYDKQILYQRVTKIFSRSGTFSMTVGLPTSSTPAKGCFYQVDLTYGIHNHTPVLAYGHGKIPQCGKQPPQPQLVCRNLTYSLVAGTERTYRFTATAAAKNTTITKYVFSFGDGKTQTVRTSNHTAQATHTYTQAGKKFTATVAVSSKDRSNVTSANCRVTLTTKKPPKTPTLICENLTFNAASDQADTYTFTATASASHTTITNYVFDFGDGTSQTVTTSATSASSTHSYGTTDQDLTATVTVNSKDIQNITGAGCKVTIPAKIKECKPGVPMGSPQCQEEQQECKPGVPMGSSECQPPVLGASTELPNTGAGDVVGFFGATAITGGLIHRFLLRRRLA